MKEKEQIVPSAHPELELAPGVSMWRRDAESVILVDSEEQFAEIVIEADAVPRVLRGDFSATSAPRLHAAVAGMLAAGYLVPVAPRSTVGVVIVGDGRLAEVLRSVFGEHITRIGAGVTTPIEILASDAPDHRRLLAADARSPRPLPVFGEGSDVAIGPWRPTSGRPSRERGPRPDYADLSARRLAAHPAPELLEEFWTVAAATNGPGAARPAASTIATAAGWLHRQLSGDAAVLGDHQVLIRADLSITAHPVLPVPGAADPHPARPAAPLPPSAATAELPVAVLRRHEAAR